MHHHTVEFQVNLCTRDRSSCFPNDSSLQTNISSPRRLRKEYRNQSPPTAFEHDYTSSLRRLNRAAHVSKRCFCDFCHRPLGQVAKIDRSVFMSILTTVVGSYPTPHWLLGNTSRTVLRDAVLVVLKTQE